MLFYKHRYIYKILTIIVLASFAGCVTTKIDYVENDGLPKEKTYRIKEVFLKDGSTVKLSDAEPKFKSSYKGLSNVIIYYDKNYAVKVITLQDISKIKIEIVEPDNVKILLITGGVLIALVMLTLYGLSRGLSPH
jgi:hypothetical protein